MRRVADAMVRRAQSLAPRKRPAILMYHRITEEDFDPWGLAVSPQRFERQMEWLAEDREMLSLSDFVRRHEEGRLSEGAVAVTFDDGYACVAKVAVPVLSRLGIPATIFIPSKLIRREREFWWDDLERIVRLAGTTQLMIDDMAISLGAQEPADDTWRPNAQPSTERQKAFLSLWSKLKGQSAKDREATLDNLRAQAGVAVEPRQSHRPMTADEVRDLASPSIEFGSHGLSHPDLLTLRPDEAREEVRASIDDCAKLVGERPSAFAFPYGRHDRRTERLAANAGYECACTAAHGFMRKSSNRFALPRIAVGDWNADVFQRKLLGG